MELNEALNILGLAGDGTKKDFTKAYKRLIRRYYSDTLMRDILKFNCDDKINKIKDGYDVVSYYLGYKSQKANDGRIYNKENELSSLKNYYKKEALKELKYINSILDVDVLFEKFRNEFVNLIYSDWYKYIDNFTNVYALNNYYNEIYRTRYFALLCCYNYEHYKKSKIVSFVNGDMKFNKNSNLKDIRDKKVVFIKNALDSMLAKYSTINDYIVLEPLLLSLKETYALICLWGHDNLSKIKVNFNREIKSCVDKYYERKKLFDELVEEYDGVIMPFHTELNRVILNEEEFYELYDKMVMPFKTRKAKKRVLRKNKK